MRAWPGAVFTGGGQPHQRRLARRGAVHPVEPNASHGVGASMQPRAAAAGSAASERAQELSCWARGYRLNHPARVFVDLEVRVPVRGRLTHSYRVRARAGAVLGRHHRSRQDARVLHRILPLAAAPHDALPSQGACPGSPAPACPCLPHVRVHDAFVCGAVQPVTSVYLYIILTGQALASAWFDDVRLVELPLPATMAAVTTRASFRVSARHAGAASPALTSLPAAALPLPLPLPCRCPCSLAYRCPLPMSALTHALPRPTARPQHPRSRGALAHGDVIGGGGGLARAAGGG